MSSGHKLIATNIPRTWMITIMVKRLAKKSLKISKMVSPGIVRQINYQSVLYLYPVVPCDVETSQLKLLTLRYECVAPRNGIVAKLSF
jgi:hypothetical protein